ncbi:MAG: hypothetical protein ACYDIE_06020 [Candidatus Krumholzibacteriia bacterium]
MRSMLVLVIIALLLASGCSDGPVGVDRGFSLIAELGVVCIEPAEYTPGSEVKLTVVCCARYTGTGQLFLVGLGGGGDVGTLEVPEEAQVGVYSCRLGFPAEPVEIPLTLLMTTTLDKPALEITVTIDSLLVGDSMVAWNSPEGYEVFRGDIPEDTMFLFNSAYEYVTIQRAGGAR